MRKTLLPIFVLGLSALAQQNNDVHVWPVRDNVFMIVGAGGDITVQTGKDGVLVVDSGLANMSDKTLAAIKSISSAPIRYLINTHYHPDHVGGNSAIRKAGSTIVGGNVSFELSGAGEGATVIAHEKLLNRVSAPTGASKQPLIPADGWPTSTFFGDSKKVYFNGEGIEVIHVANAHTDGDSIVFFRKSDVIATGDLFTTVMYPVIDVPGGGTINGFIEALDRIIDLAIPVYGQDGGTLIVPGHGRLCDIGDVLNYREMTIIIRDRIQDLIKKGMTLEQVKAAKPTFDYDPLYGATTGFWTTDKFIESVYSTLKK